MNDILSQDGFIFRNKERKTIDLCLEVVTRMAADLVKINSKKQMLSNIENCTVQSEYSCILNNISLWFDCMYKKKHTQRKL